MHTANKNMLHNALKEDELARLLTGEGDYFVENRQMPEEPQNFNHVWNVLLVPAIREEGFDKYRGALEKALRKLCEYPGDPARGLYAFVSYMVTYFYQKNVKGSIDFSLPLDWILPQFKKAVSAQAEQLRGDTRWAGAEWNHANQGKGLLGVIESQNQKIKEKLGGPDLLA